MALLYMPKPMLLEDLDAWVKAESKRWVPRPEFPRGMFGKGQNR